MHRECINVDLEIDSPDTETKDTFIVLYERDQALT